MLHRKGFVGHREQHWECLFSTFCVDFLRCTDIFYYIILYVVWEVVTGKMRNLQKSIEKVALCAGKSFEKVAISTKTRLKKCEICQKSLEKNEEVSNRWKITCFFRCFVVFYESGGLTKNSMQECCLTYNQPLLHSQNLLAMATETLQNSTKKLFLSCAG